MERFHVTEECQQLYLWRIGCPICTYDPFIVGIGNGELCGQFDLSNCNPELLLISGSSPSWKGLGHSKLQDGS